MKKTIIIAVIVLSLVLLAAVFGLTNITGQYLFFESKALEKPVLGYCPTMKDSAEDLSLKKDYALIEFGSASDVLAALNRDKIDAALIGRKAKNYEIPGDATEIILKSGYTLTSSQKSFIGISELKDIEIHTYLSEKEVSSVLPDGADVIYYSSKSEALDKISKDNFVLISWEDWQNDFELVVVLDGNVKAKEFRGVFLYEN